MQRAGNRRYYRPADVELVRRINRLLNEEGYTVRGVQKLLREKDSPAPEPATDLQAAVRQVQQEQATGVDVFRLMELRDRLVDALDG
jgi:DNA-binding transcriptional MerR regulator